MVLNSFYRGYNFRVAVGITVMAILLLTGGAGAATLTVNASGGADYTRIQDAIDNASAGDTILVYSGTYYENVNVTKQLILHGIDNGGGKPVVNAGGSESAITFSANGSILEGFDTRNSGWWPYAGIYVSSGSNVIKNNNASGNANGIRLDSSSNNTLSGNDASSNGYGISLSSSSNNTLSGNKASNNGYGISLSSSSSNTLSDNYANSNNGYGISLGPDSNNNIMSGNNASNNGDYGISLGSDSNNNIMSGNNASNNGYGIVIGGSNNTLSNNNVNSNNWTGISLYSSNNTLSDNNVNSNNNYGISLQDYSDNNVLSGNNVNSNNWTGLYLFDSSNNLLSGNNANSNNNYGIFLENYASYNVLNDNNANSNNWDGILIRHSSGNTLKGNTVSSNTLHGILLDHESSSNIIYNNYFNNTNNSYYNSFNGLILSNTWNITKTAGTNIIGGPYLGGNFWANPSGTGFSQTCTDSNGDGICDSPYILNSSNIDQLPLTIPTVPPTGAPNITSFSPRISQVNNFVGGTQTFNIKVNQTVNVVWYINGTEILNETGVTTSSYTNASAILGTWNVIAVASNTNGSTTQTWIWTVIPVSTTGSISGFNINDTNGNGKWDAGKSGISSWTIRLIGITGLGKNTVIIRKETSTDATGYYRFDNLPAGRYIVTEKLQKGYVPIGSPVKNIKLAQGESSMNNNFTNRPINRIHDIDYHGDIDHKEMN